MKTSAIAGLATDNGDDITGSAIKSRPRVQSIGISDYGLRATISQPPPRALLLFKMSIAMHNAAMG